ncbi:MAG: HEAT repeat domain-containing protein [Verrucomicrobiota bacterium]
MASRSTARLLELLDHPNKWHRLAAVQVLGERRDPAAVPTLREKIASGSGHAPLQALWALHQAAGLDPATAARALGHRDPAVRGWTARLLGDRHGVSRNPALPGTGGTPAPLAPALLEALVGQARVEPVAEVRAQLASTARRLAPAQALPILTALLTHPEDVDDPFLPLLCWWVLESQLPAEGDRLMAWLQDRALWSEPLFVRQILPRLARRCAAEGRRQDLLRVAQLLRQAPGPGEAGQVLQGFEEAYRGRPMTGLPVELAEALARAGQPSLSLRLRRGDPAAVPEAIAHLANPSAPPGDRLSAARLLGEIRAPAAVPALLDVATGNHPADLRRAACAALGNFDAPDIPERTLKALPGLPVEVRSAALALLTGREAWTRRLLQEIQSGALDRSLVPAEAADRLRAHRDPGLRSAAESALAATPRPPGGPARQAEIEAVLRAGAGNPYAGEATFLERCASCHRLFFKGGRVGPDLTAYQRDNLGTLLPSLLNPSAEIREGYQYVTVETRDGRSLAGFLVDRDAQVTVLRGLDGQDVTVAADEIREVQPMGRSLMPEGLLEGLGDRELRDFFAYLRISQPISR